MKSVLPFIKMQGLGNDYVYVDAFPAQVAELLSKTNLPALARRVSDRHFGIGSDGLVLILPSKTADARMRIFNADGSEAQMCGNAIRCVAKYLYESGLCRDMHMQIETLAGMRTLTVHVSHEIVDEVTVNMGKPVIKPSEVQIDRNLIGYTSVDMGNPHAVFFRENVSTPPEDTNVEFVRVRNDKELDVRVIERGSGETLACGTGACASVAAAIFHGLTQREVTVHLPGGDLFIQWLDNDKSVFMTGPATEVFRGELSL